MTSSTLLVTAQINIFDHQRQPIRCRALLDTGASVNFITERLANQLGLVQQKCFVPIGVLDTLTTASKRAIKATIQSSSGNYERTLTFLVIPNISPLVPEQQVDRSLLNIPRNITLADPHYHCPAPIGVLLNAGTTLSLLNIGLVNLTVRIGPDLYLQKARLGWVIGRTAPQSSSKRVVACHSTATLQADLTRFWELEEGPQTTHLSESDKICEAHFLSNTIRNYNGRYAVALPFNDKISLFGESRSQAMRRFISLERRLQRDAELRHEYHAVIQEYLDLGHMSEIEDECSATNGYYLPHHGVLKASSQTTKLRVVFDGSAKTSSGVSLNDTLHTGPKIQDDLLCILLRFRTHQYVLTGDIEKIYRQILVRPKDRQFQRILWRDANGKVKTYQLNTVAFGLSAAPSLAIRCLSKLAEDEGHRFPNGARILQRDFYVDDALTGANTKEKNCPIYYRRLT